MNNRTVVQILLIFILSILFTTPAFADRFVQQETFEGEILANGQVVSTNNELKNVNVLGYVCRSSGCATADTVFIDTTTGSDNKVTLQYPEHLQSPFGYGVFFYKPGYITWEVRADWFGTHPNDPQGPFPAYLTRAEGCRAPIDTFEVINEALPNQPIMIDMTASLDATTRSALFNSGPVDFIPAELRSFYQVETEVVLEVIDEHNQVIHRATKDVQVDFDGEIRVEFEYIPREIGRFKARVSTNVVDPKCSSSLSEDSRKNFNIITQNPKNQCFTLLNNLVALPIKQPVNTPVNIQLDSIASQYNDLGELAPKETKLDITITHNGEVQFQTSKLVPPGADEFDTQVSQFTFVPKKAGEHIINVKSDVQCDYPEEINDEVSLVYFVRGSERPDFRPLPDQVFDKNSGFQNDLFDLDDFASDPENDPLQFSINKQTNTNVVVCSIDAQNRMDCAVQPNQVGVSLVTVQVTDGTSFESETFKVTVDGGENPALSIPDVELEQNSRFNLAVLDLFDFASDKEDSVQELIYQIVSESNIGLADCSLSSRRLVDCFVKDNKVGTSAVTVQVTDTDGNSVQDTFNVIVKAVAPKVFQCNDGLDNDNDGLVDLLDPGCFNPQDDDESDGTSQCQDGLDNDNDGYIDFPADPGCDSPQDNDEFNKDFDVDLSFNVNPTVGDAPLTIDAVCTLENAKLPAVLEIDVGDGTPSVAIQVDDLKDSLSITHTYNTPGTFTVTCTGTGADGDEEKQFRTVVVKQPFIADCSDGIDNDLDGLIDFPADPGCQSPDDDDEFNQIDNKVDITFIADPQQGTVPLEVEFECRVNSGDAPARVDFDFGDGNTLTQTFNKIPANLIVNHVYQSAGNFIASCTVTDKDGDKDKETQVIYVEDKNKLVDVDFIANPTSGDAPLQVDFVCQMEDGDLPGKLTLNFGDGNSVQTSVTKLRTTIQTTHTYQQPGDFLAQCIGEDANGDFDVISIGIQVNEVQKAQCEDGIDNDNDGLIDFPADPGCDSPSDDDEFNIVNQIVDLDFTASTTNGEAPLNVDFTCDVTSADLPAQVLIHFGDGQQVEAQLTSLPSTVQVSHTYNQPGTFNSQCTVIDFNLDIGQENIFITVDQAVPKQCADGIDNDGDGLIDLQDPGCENANDDDESDGTSQCQDGIDNDNNGLIDFPADPGCDSPQDNTEFTPFVGQCRDGIDNDNDGLTDEQDPACIRGMQTEDQDPSESNNLFLAGIDIIDDGSRSGIMEFRVGMRNQESQDVENVKMNIFVPQLGVKASVGPFTLDGKDRENKRVLIPVYGPVHPGEYTMRISVTSSGETRIKHRSFIVR